MSLDIKKSRDAQEKEKRRRAKSITEDTVDKNKFVSYDITFAGREIPIFFNEKHGEIVVEGIKFKPIVKELEGYIGVKVSGHQYKISTSSGKVFLDGREVDFSYTPSVVKINRKFLSVSGSEVIRAPLPGIIVSINVKKGDFVKPGQKVCTLEAMKMQNELIAEKGGKVSDIYVKLHSQVDTNLELLRLTDEKPR